MSLAVGKILINVGKQSLIVIYVYTNIYRYILAGEYSRFRILSSEFRTRLKFSKTFLSTKLIAQTLPFEKRKARKGIVITNRIALLLN